MRVFLIGRSPEDLARLRARVERDPLLHILGSALERDIAAQTVGVPETIDAVILSPAALLGRGDATHTAALPTNEAGPLYEDLTPRERDVLALVFDGCSNRAIAERLGVSEHTVKFHLTSLFGKLGASTRTEAVRKGLELGIIDI